MIFIRESHEWKKRITKTVLAKLPFDFKYVSEITGKYCLLQKTSLMPFMIKLYVIYSVRSSLGKRTVFMNCLYLAASRCRDYFEACREGSVSFT